MTACPECGGAECEARFHEFLSLEYVDPEYGAVHHLTVAAYMLQHSSRLSREGWLLERKLSGQFIQGAVTPDQLRRHIRLAMDGGRRRFKIKSVDREPLFRDVQWSRTIRDVRPEPPQTYRDDVTAWARLTLHDCHRIVLESHES